MSEQKPIDLITFRGRLEGRTGREYWRSLEELAEEEGFQQFLDREFPGHGAGWESAVDRRDFLKVMGASIAFAGLTGCDRPPPEKIVPYVRAPEEFIPGKPLQYATAMNVGASVIGLLVESHMGRPTKIEGNPDHPACLGATDIHAQAAILGLYDPDRAQTVRKLGGITTWTDFIAALSERLRQHEANGGSGLRLLTETIVSPTLADQIRVALAKWPGMRWHQYDPGTVTSGGGVRAGGSPIYDLSAADVILTVDADLLASGAGSLRYAREFARRRKVRLGGTSINRLYAVESTPTPTGAIADHRLPIPPSRLAGFVAALAGELGVASASAGSGGDHGAWIAAMARDLRGSRGRALVVAGDHLPAEIHAIVDRINENLGAVGTTVRYRQPVDQRAVDPMSSLRALVREMEAGAVETLIILDGNPVFAAPADLDFAKALEKVPFRAHMSGYYDETSERCHWHVPQTHFLESWSDLQAWDGTCSIVQPLIQPLYNSRSPHELMGLLTGAMETNPHELVREYWRHRATVAELDSWWTRVVHDGVILESSIAPAAALPVPAGAGEPVPKPPAAGAGLEIVFRLDPNLHDGRFANNGWLQECPRPLSKLTWDNAALISPAT
ncbi:MAG TPA: TAT-variant-translocated molybdopterin oxidoreductase, partial [Thermoanaerobaculia bacterium]|nr:TAT-variant-translocated molybdopterin oxidoreductase [Thermoanaerobaculia bacterium]